MAPTAFVWALSFAGFGYVFGKALERMIGDIVLAFGLTMLTMFALVFIGTVIARRRRSSLRPPPGVPNEPRSP